jgi:HprK-related kinase A
LGIPHSRINSIDPGGFRRALKAGNVAIQTGPLTFRVRTPLADVARSIHLLYAEHPAVIAPAFSDFHVEIGLPANLRRYFRPQVHFAIDGERPFQPLPRDQAPALLEWGMNWSIASICHQWFTLHAASLERNGYAVILPAPPGTGKSTLCAALSLRKWRLLSDELTLLDHDSLAAHALARPINLKNQSIELIRRFEPRTRWAPTVYDTHKGLVTHLAPPKESVERMQETALPRWIVFPKFVAGAAPELLPKRKAETFIEMARNAFNYSVLGETGFDVVHRLIDQCECFTFTYSRLDDALQVFDELVTGAEA